MFIDSISLIYEMKADYVWWASEVIFIDLMSLIYEMKTDYVFFFLFFFISLFSVCSLSLWHFSS